MIPGSANPLLLGQTGTGDFSIERSLRFNSADSAYLSRTPSSASNRRTWTWSGWVKKSEIISSGDRQLFGSNSSAGNEYNGIAFVSTNKLNFRFNDSTSVQIRSDAVFRDPSAWLNIVCVADTSQSTASDRLKIYVNGSQITNFDQSSYPSQNAESSINSTEVHEIGRRAEDGAQYFNGYLAEVNFIDGSALDPTSFGAFDLNGVWQAIDTSGLTFGTNGFRLKFADTSSNAALGTDSSGNSNTWTVNNLSVGTVSNLTAKQNFDVVTYSGNGGTQSISSLAFQPDFVWIKSRTSNDSPHLYDSIRGTARLSSAATNSEYDNGDFSSFDSAGFTVTGGKNQTNGSSKNYVAWCWKAGGSASSNTDGTITSSVSANAAYGFSITSFTVGSAPYTVGHGLGNIPKLIIMKSKSGSTNWNVYHDSTGNQSRSYLNLTNGASSGEACWNSTSPTSSVFSMGSSGEFSGDMVAYCWSEVAGFSKFGSWTGNGSSTGPTITTGFKPRFLLWKKDGVANWYIYDTARQSSNPLNKNLEPNTSDAENVLTSMNIDFLSDGFQLKGTDGDMNGNGSTYIYAAFAATVDESAINDCFVDTPSNAVEPTDTGVGNEVVGNYCLMNPLDKGSTIVLSNGNLDLSRSSGGWANSGARATFGVSSGKWYWEITKTSAQPYSIYGVAVSEASLSEDYGAPNNETWSYISNSGNKLGDSYGGGGASYGESFTNGDVIGVALDADAGTLTFYKNGASQGTAFSSLSGKTLFPHIAVYQSTDSAVVNFGQRPFAHPLSSNPIYSQSVSGPVSVSPYDVNNMFDGSLTSYADHQGQNTTITWTYTLTNVTSLRVYIHQGNSTGTVATVGGNGTQTDTISTNFGPDWHTISLSSTGSTINSIAFTRGGSGNPLSIYAIEVNGTVLVEGAGAIYKSLNTANLPEPTIADSSQYFDTKLYTGNGANSRTISGYGFSPDFLWVKNRDNTAGDYSHRLMDAVRGAGVSLRSNGTDSERDHSAQAGGGIETFTSDGFTIEQGTSNNNNQNNNNSTYVAWAWDGGSSNTTMTAGSLNSSAYNQSQTWSNYITGNVDPSYPLTNLFGGSIGSAYTSGTRSTNPGTLTLDLSTLNINVTTVTLYTYIYNTPSNFTVNGVTVDRGTGNGDKVYTVNVNGQLNSIAWSYDSGSGPYCYMQGIKIDGALLTDSGVTPPNVPSIASTVRANPSAGFSICTYTGNGSSGASIGHGLNDAPAFVVVKNRNLSTQGWCVYHSSIGATKYVQLNTTSAAASYGGTWNNTSPTSSVFTVGNDNIVNQNNSTYVAYCFAPVAGYSAMGSYEGLGTAGGAFVFLGFRPALLIVKDVDGTWDWYMYDAVRNTYNVVNNVLRPSGSNAEESHGTNNTFDFLSNGFKVRGSTSQSEPTNYSGHTYIYYAVAENPFHANGGLAR